MKLEYCNGCKVELTHNPKSKEWLLRVLKRIKEKYPGAEVSTTEDPVFSGIAAKSAFVPCGHPLNFSIIDSHGNLKAWGGRLILQFIRRTISEEREPSRYSQRPQLSCFVLAPGQRQPRSWL